MDYKEAARSVGKRVLYARPGALGGEMLESYGTIEAMKQMPLVRFDDGSLLQVNPCCLTVVEGPNTGGAASLGYGEWNRQGELFE